MLNPGGSQNREPPTTWRHRDMAFYHKGIESLGETEFPRKPLLDRIIVREIPIEEYYEQPEGIAVDLQNAHISARSDRGVVVAVGDCVPAGGVILPMPVKVDDVV